MLLILTHSEDHTSNELISLLNGIPLFRFNIDLWRNYLWEVNGNGFRIQDPTGRVCEESGVYALYLRKFFFDPVYVDVPAGGCEEAWRREELLQLFLGIRDLAFASGKLALVKPASAVSKVRQMRLAKYWFPVPEWKAFHGGFPRAFKTGTVVKTFAATPLGNGAHLLVKEVDAGCLSSEFPWFIQEKTPASHDVTVVYVNGRLFAYELSRDFDGMDSRLATSERDSIWPPCEICQHEAVGIRAIMTELNLTFGRFDFLRVNGQLWFLEVNPNGQWGWLDPRRDNGLYQAVADEIRAVWERNEAGKIPV